MILPSPVFLLSSSPPRWVGLENLTMQSPFPLECVVWGQLAVQRWTLAAWGYFSGDLTRG